MHSSLGQTAWLAVLASAEWKGPRSSGSSAGPHAFLASSTATPSGSNRPTARRSSSPRTSWRTSARYENEPFLSCPAGEFVWRGQIFPVRLIPSPIILLCPLLLSCVVCWSPNSGGPRRASISFLLFRYCHYAGFFFLSYYIRVCSSSGGGSSGSPPKVPCD